MNHSTSWAIHRAFKKHLPKYPVSNMDNASTKNSILQERIYCIHRTRNCPCEVSKTELGKVFKFAKCDHVYPLPAQFKQRCTLFPSQVGHKQGLVTTGSNRGDQSIDEVPWHNLQPMKPFPWQTVQRGAVFFFCDSTIPWNAWIEIEDTNDKVKTPAINAPPAVTISLSGPLIMQSRLSSRLQRL